MNIRCNGCNTHPGDIGEYVEMGEIEKMTPERFVIEEDGTYNKSNGHFWCTLCYLVAGSPMGKAE